MTAANPPVLGGVAPYLGVSNASKAADFYAKAFGASEVARLPPDEKGRYLHIHLVINGGSVMLADAFPDHGHPLETPGAFMLHLQVDDVDAWWKRAVEAGTLNGITSAVTYRVSVPSVRRIGREVTGALPVFA